jgi:hypothetical protein
MYTVHCTAYRIVLKKLPKLTEYGPYHGCEIIPDHILFAHLGWVLPLTFKFLLDQHFLTYLVN